MDLRNFGEGTKVLLVGQRAASAGTPINSGAVDTSGFRGACFFVELVTANAGNSVNLAESDASGGAFADLEGSVTTTTNNQVAMVSVWTPSEPWLRLEIDRSGALTATGDIYCVLYNPVRIPVTQDASVVHQHTVAPMPTP